MLKQFKLFFDWGRLGGFTPSTLVDGADFEVVW